MENSLACTASCSCFLLHFRVSIAHVLENQRALFPDVVVLALYVPEVFTFFCALLSTQAVR
jgi:hypothetical protein